MKVFHPSPVRLLLVATIVLFSLFKCRNHDDISSSLDINKREQLNQQWAYIGQKHNEGLDIILSEIKKLPNRPTDDKEVFVQKLKAVSFHYLDLSLDAITGRSVLSKEKQLQVFDKNFTGQIDLDYSSANGRIAASEKYTNSVTLNPNFSAELQDLLQETISIVDEQDNSVEDVKRSIAALQLKAVSQLKPEELNVLFIASNVGMYSHEYWTNHADEWLSAIQKLQNKKASGGRLRAAQPLMKGVKGSDVGGAVGGAVVAALTGVGELTFGAGIAVGALTGATGASTGKFIENAWNAAFGEN